MTTPLDPEGDVGPLLDPAGGPPEPTPEFTPTPTAEELADWVAGDSEDEEGDNGSSSEVPAPGRRVYARPPDEVFDTPRALDAWIEQFLDEYLAE